MILHATAPLLDDEPTDLTEPDRRDLVAEAFHTFGEDAARALADHFAVPFDACREGIERLQRRPA